MTVFATTTQCLPAGLLLLAAPPVCAQRLSVRHYDVSDGLAHSHVGAIHQDRKGYLWFGAWEGLSRFDVGARAQLAIPLARPWLGA